MIDAKPKASAVWHTFGGQLLQAGTTFYVSPFTADENKPWRGGVPILFPQFGDHGRLPKHGFARTMQWQRNDDNTWELQIEAHQYSQWPYASRLEISLTPDTRGLHIGAHLQLLVTNEGEDSFEFTGGLHPYWAVNDVTSAIVSGLSSLAIDDLYEPSRVALPDHWRFSDGEALEVLAQGCPDLVLTDTHRRLQLCSSGFTEWMIWHPGHELAAGLGDMPQTDWKRFVCIEPVCVKQPIVLNAGQTRCFSLSWHLL